MEKYSALLLYSLGFKTALIINTSILAHCLSSSTKDNQSLEGQPGSHSKIFPQKKRER